MLEVLTRTNLPVPKTPSHPLTQWQYIEGAKHDGFGEKREILVLFCSALPRYIFTFLSCTDLNILHFYKDLSAMILDKTKLVIVFFLFELQLTACLCSLNTTDRTLILITFKGFGKISTSVLHVEAPWL